MSLDPHHVHNFWGVSPGLDLKALVRAARQTAAVASGPEEAYPGASDGDDPGGVEGNKGRVQGLGCRV
jgi:hypothetical protein